MASVNKVILVGNLGADPEIRYTPNNEQVTNIRLATTDTWRDKQTGEKREQTEWHRIVFFGNLAEIAGQYLKKGSSVYIEGRLRTRKWQGQDGQDRYSTEIVADQMQMLGLDEGMGTPSEEGGSAARAAAPARSTAGPSSRPAPQASPAPAASGFEDSGQRLRRHR